MAKLKENTAKFEELKVHLSESFEKISRIVQGINSVYDKPFGDVISDVDIVASAIAELECEAAGVQELGSVGDDLLSILDALDCRDTPKGKDIQTTMDNISARYSNLREMATVKQTHLDESAVQSMLNWVDVAKKQFDEAPAASLDRDTLNTQVQSQREVMTDIETHNTQIHSLLDRWSTKPTYADRCKTLLEELNQINSQAQDRGNKLEFMVEKLEAFHLSVYQLESWYMYVKQSIKQESMDLAFLFNKFENLYKQRSEKKEHLDTAHVMHKQLLDDSGYGDKDKLDTLIEELDKNWKSITEQFVERVHTNSEREMSELSKYMEKAAKSLVSSEPISTEVEAVTKQYADHQAAHTERKKKHKAVTDAIYKYKSMYKSLADQEPTTIHTRWLSVHKDALAVIKTSEEKLALLEEAQPAQMSADIDLDDTLESWIELDALDEEDRKLKNDKSTKKTDSTKKVSSHSSSSDRKPRSSSREYKKNLSSSSSKSNNKSPRDIKKEPSRSETKPSKVDAKATEKKDERRSSSSKRSDDKGKKDDPKKDKIKVEPKTPEKRDKSKKDDTKKDDTKKDVAKKDDLKKDDLKKDDSKKDDMKKDDAKKPAEKSEKEEASKKDQTDGKKTDSKNLERKDKDKPKQNDKTKKAEPKKDEKSKMEDKTKKEEPKKDEQSKKEDNKRKSDTKSDQPATKKDRKSLDDETAKSGDAAVVEVKNEGKESDVSIELNLFGGKFNRREPKNGILISNYKDVISRKAVRDFVMSADVKVGDVLFLSKGSSDERRVFIALNDTSDVEKCVAKLNNTKLKEDIVTVQKANNIKQKAEVHSIFDTPGANEAQKKSKTTGEAKKKILTLDEIKEKRDFPLGLPKTRTRRTQWESRQVSGRRSADNRDKSKPKMVFTLTELRGQRNTDRRRRSPERERPVRDRRERETAHDRMVPRNRGVPQERGEGPRRGDIQEMDPRLRLQEYQLELERHKVRMEQERLQRECLESERARIALEREKQKREMELIKMYEHDPSRKSYKRSGSPTYRDDGGVWLQPKRLSVDRLHMQSRPSDKKIIPVSAGLAEGSRHLHIAPPINRLHPPSVSQPTPLMQYPVGPQIQPAANVQHWANNGSKHGHNYSPWQ